MKKLLLTVSTSLSLTVSVFCQTDVKYSPQPSVGVMFGNTFGSGFTGGVSLNNIIKKSVGLYFISYYFNTEESGNGETHFSTSFGYHDIETKTTEKLKPYCMSFGLTYNLSKIFNLNDDLGLTIYTGIGNVKEKTQTKTSTTRFYNNEYLSTTHRTTVDVVEVKTLSYEILLSYDFMRKNDNGMSLTTSVGYFSNCGVVVLVGTGLKISNY